MSDLTQSPTTGHLAVLLAAIEANDQKYVPRYRLVVTAVAVAVGLGYRAGFRVDFNAPDWPVAFIELPEGQVSWHLPQHETRWDGHGPTEKYRRCRAFIENQSKGTR